MELISRNLLLAMAEATKEQAIAVKGIITVKVIAGGVLSNISLTGPLDIITDFLGKSLILELISSDNEGKTLKGYASKVFQDIDDVKYECNFQVPVSFGEVGAVFVDNEHHKEILCTSKTLFSRICALVLSLLLVIPGLLLNLRDCSLPIRSPCHHRPAGLKKLRERTGGSAR